MINIIKLQKVKILKLFQIYINVKDVIKMNVIYINYKQEVQMNQ